MFITTHPTLRVLLALLAICFIVVPVWLLLTHVDACEADALTVIDDAVAREAVDIDEYTNAEDGNVILDGLASALLIKYGGSNAGTLDLVRVIQANGFSYFDESVQQETAWNEVYIIEPGRFEDCWDGYAYVGKEKAD